MPSWAEVDDVMVCGEHSSNGCTTYNKYTFYKMKSNGKRGRFSKAKALAQLG